MSNVSNDHSFKTGDNQLLYRDALIRRNIDALQIRGPRVLIRPITVDDMPSVFTEFTPKVATYMTPKPASEDKDTLDFINWAIKERHSGRDLQLVITLEATGEFIGCIGIHSRFGARTPEIGLWIKESSFGNKYGIEAVIALKEWAEKNIDLDYFVYPVAIDNIPSRKIPESFGSTVASTLDAERTWSTPLNMVVYHIPKAL